MLAVALWIQSRMMRLMLPIMTKKPHIRNREAWRGGRVQTLADSLKMRFLVTLQEFCRFSNVLVSMLVLSPYPNLLHRLHGLLLDQFDVESRGQDEDEHGGSRGTWSREDI